MNATHGADYNAIDEWYGKGPQKIPFLHIIKWHREDRAVYTGPEEPINAKTDEPEKIDQQDIQVVVPSQRQKGQMERNPFDKSHFSYEREGDCYVCPEGKVLRCFAKTKKVRHYGMEDGRTCGKCRSSQAY